MSKKVIVAGRIKRSFDANADNQASDVFAFLGKQCFGKVYIKGLEVTTPCILTILDASENVLAQVTSSSDVEALKFSATFEGLADRIQFQTSTAGAVSSPSVMDFEYVIAAEAL